MKAQEEFPYDAWKKERNRIRFFDDNSTQSFDQWSKIAEHENTETESIRVSRELLHTLRDRSRGEGMVRGGKAVNDRDYVTLFSCER